MIFPKHKCGLYLTHNAHRDYYTKISEYIEDRNLSDEFKDSTSRLESIRKDEIWELQWYPDTPIGSYSAAAPTLEGVLERALEIEAGTIAQRASAKEE